MTRHAPRTVTEAPPRPFPVEIDRDKVATAGSKGAERKRCSLKRMKAHSDVKPWPSATGRSLTRGRGDDRNRRGGRAFTRNFKRMTEASNAALPCQAEGVSEHGTGRAAMQYQQPRRGDPREPHTISWKHIAYALIAAGRRFRSKNGSQNEPPDDV
ncbi:hypothetical protein BD626DRAFT_245400 [Schizophyllum amplum]|uniref:Uncharacterized protein n=1 Tax=Schizophyllum amplum TaxID=97359 RepID=A0A550BVK2_9AGAR|nr:hypothetical protein BD626DRAFT_245400 [Auriculariopsis ampla]